MSNDLKSQAYDGTAGPELYSDEYSRLNAPLFATLEQKEIKPRHLNQAPPRQYQVLPITELRMSGFDYAALKREEYQRYVAHRAFIKDGKAREVQSQQMMLAPKKVA